MKNVVMILIVVCLLLSLCSCDWGPKYVSDYDESRWVAQEADIYFDVSDRFYDETISNAKGIVATSTGPIEVVILCAHGGKIYFLPISDTFDAKGEPQKATSTSDSILSGNSDDRNCKSFTLVIDYCAPGILDESITELTFVREDIPEE